MITGGSKEHPVNLNTHLWGLIIKEVHWRSGSFGVLQADIPSSVGLQWITPVALSEGTISETTITKDVVTAHGAINDVQTNPIKIRTLYEKRIPYKLIESTVFPDDILPGDVTYDEYKAMWIAGGDPWQEIYDLRTNTKDILSTDRVGWPGTLNYPADWSAGANHYGTWSDGSPGYFPPPPQPSPNYAWGLGEVRKEIKSNLDLDRLIWLLDFRKQVKLRDGSTDPRIGNYTVSLNNIHAKHDDELGSFDMPFTLKIYPVSITLTNTGQTLTADKPASYTRTKSWPYDANGEMFKISKSGFV